MFQGLSQRLTSIFDNLTHKGLLSEKAVDDTVREIKIALIEADVALPVVKSFVAAVREKAVGEKIIKSISPAQMVVKIVHDELVALLGESAPLNFTEKRVNTVLLVGLQGAGKTTSCAKLALRLKKQGKTVLMASVDTYRPAAQEQLAELAHKNEIDILPIIAGQHPLEITTRALQMAKTGVYDVLLIDTAGRLHIDDTMMNEVAKIKALSIPAETLLVVDSMMGQDSVNVATHFKEKIGITGTILTRIDGDSRGGAALSMRYITEMPIQFLGVGEKVEALEVFDAKRVADRILGMGDVVGLVETAMEKINQEQAEHTANRMLSGKFDLTDMLSQIEQIANMGDIKGIMKMIPGMGKMQEKIKENIDDKLISHQKAIILSMTMKERKNPTLLKASRKIRIANGAGVHVSEVNKLLKQYEKTATMMKHMKKMNPASMMNMMKGMKGMNGMSDFGAMPDMPTMPDLKNMPQKPKISDLLKMMKG